MNALKRILGIAPEPESSVKGRVERFGVFRGDAPTEFIARIEGDPRWFNINSSVIYGNGRERSSSGYDICLTKPGDVVRMTIKASEDNLKAPCVTSFVNESI